MLNITAVFVSLVLLAVVAVVLNILCIVIIVITEKLRKKPSSIFVLNLLTVHLVQGLFLFPFYAGKKMKVSNLFWKRFFANGFRVSYMLTFYGTCLGVLAISVDRFLATYWLQHYKPRVTKKRITIALLALWTYITSLCMIPFIPEEKASPVPSVNTTKRWPTLYYYNQQDEWVVFMLTVNAVLPYVLIISCYVYIIFRLKVIEKSRPRSMSAKTLMLVDKDGKEVEFRRKDVEKYKQVTWLTFILVIMYGLFWSPSVLYYPLLAMCGRCFPDDWDGSTAETYLGFIVKYLAFLDAVAAPLVYCFYHAEFRSSLMRMRSKLLRKPLPEVIPAESTDLL